MTLNSKYAMKTKLMMAVHRPKEMTWLEKTSEFSIVWEDNHKTTFPFTYLRKECPCALCRTKRESTNPFQLISETASFASMAKDISSVGHYAIKIDWADGHSSGIYTFDMLRSLCPCAHCKHA